MSHLGHGSLTTAGRLKIWRVPGEWGPQALPQCHRKAEGTCRGAGSEEGFWLEQHPSSRDIPDRADRLERITAVLYGSHKDDATDDFVLQLENRVSDVETIIRLYLMI